MLAHPHAQLLLGPQIVVPAALDRDEATILGGRRQQPGVREGADRVFAPVEHQQRRLDVAGQLAPVEPPPPRPHPEEHPKQRDRRAQVQTMRDALEPDDIPRRR